MDNAIKAIVAAGIINLLTNNLVLAMSIGWMVYFYVMSEDKKSN